MAYEITKESSLPNGEAEIILAFLLGQSREFLLTHPETIISPALYKKFKTLAAKRLKNWPIAYLIGQKGFYGLDFRVSPAVLTPRPETEMIVEEIVDTIRRQVKLAADEKQKPGPLIIDLGTGSGAIIIAVGSELRRLFPARFPQIKLAAVDISAAALPVARHNARRYRLSRKIKFYCGNLLAPLKLAPKNIAGRKLIITANLPYLTPAQIKKSPSISQEPRLALDGGTDGLKYYQKLFRQLACLDFSGTDVIVLCEIDPGQTAAGIKLVKKYFPTAAVEIKKDLNKKNRLLAVKI